MIQQMRSLHQLRALLLTILLTFPSHAQDLARRLILKDGSYQLVTKYEVKGDRVRYLSSERDDWEELPANLVDWPATEKYERERAAGQSAPEAVQLDKEIEQERDRQESQLPQVDPGIRLPDESGVFLLDSFQGEPEIVEVQQTAGDVNQGSRANIFRGALTGLKQTIELPGDHAAVQSHVDVPSLYINVDAAPDVPSDSARVNQSPQQGSQPGRQPGPQQPQQASVPFDRFHIVRTEVKNGKRIVGDVKRQVTGKISQEQHVVKTTITRVSGGWFKLTPVDNLPPGEYALIETLGQTDAVGKQAMNLYVWDFGVNPKAPENPSPWKPNVKEITKPAAGKPEDSRE